MSPLAVLRALRPEQWSKNVFVLAALVFALGDQSVTIESADVVRTLVAFAAFCVTSSAIYLFNDCRDVEGDRAHPEKRKRPIASGELAVGHALALSGILVLLGVALAFWVGGSPYPLVLVLGVYVAINLAYCLKLKHVVLVDAFCIATGFLLRVAAGGVAAGAGVSKWLFLCTLFLALFLALNKRRAEITLLGEASGTHRANLHDYSIGFLDQMVGVLAACTIVAYTMYTVDPDTVSKFGAGDRLFWTVPFVAFGIGRYMLLVQKDGQGGSPTRIFLGGDVPFLINTLAWAGTVLFLLFVSE